MEIKGLCLVKFLEMRVVFFLEKVVDIRYLIFFLFYSEWYMFVLMF